MASNADRVIQMLRHAGVPCLFGSPDGPVGADLVDAARRAGLPFCAAHGSAAAAFMACAQAERTGRPGAVIASPGAGAAAILPGIAHANLDRIPLIAITGCHGETEVHHQELPHGDLFAPLVKATTRLSGQRVCEDLQQLLAALAAEPPGPVHLDISSESIELAAPGAWAPPAAAATRLAPPVVPAEIRRMLSQARHPVLLFGLGARNAAVARLAQELAIPALVTPKAKGVVPDHHPWFAGVLTNGARERPLLDRADLFVAVGLEPAELLPRVWPFSQPVIALNPWHMSQRQIPYAVELVCDMAAGLDLLAADLMAAAWTQFELHSLRRVGAGSVTPLDRAVQQAANAWPGALAAVDPGPHFASVMSNWPAGEPAGVLVSGGLAAPGFAVPAAIGAALLDPGRAVAVFTGEEGLLASLAELHTAACAKLPLRIVVFPGSASVDWAGAASSLGLPGCAVNDQETLADALRESAAFPGPSLISAGGLR
jgi:acetolactate synthase I/II/III large subunit